MFTGIIQAVGHVAALQPQGGDVHLWVVAPSMDWSDLALGDSVATNGICLTAVKRTEQGFWADVSNETLAHTSLGHWQPGQPVNLEKALTPQSRLGGHIVSGHVDGVGRIVSRVADARSERFVVEAPAALAKYIAHKGSITLDGVSLTVNAVKGCCFELNIVPHSLANTIMASYRPGQAVNLEVDVLARYLERLMLGEKAAEGSPLTEAFLAEHGYWK